MGIYIKERDSDNGGIDGIEVLQNSISVVNPATGLNFTGAVEVTDLGSGVAGIQILRYWTESQPSTVVSAFTPRGADTNIRALILPKGNGGFGAGRSPQPNGSFSVAIGDQMIVGGGESVGLGTQGIIIGSNAGGFGRRPVVTQTSGYAYDSDCRTEQAESKSTGLGALQKNRSFEALANSRGNSFGNANIDSYAGKNQIQRGIVGWDSRLTGGSPDKLLETEDYIDLNNTFIANSANTPTVHFTPSSDDRLVHFRALVTFYVHSVSGTLGTISAGDKKVVLIERCGIKTGGTLTLLGTLGTAVKFEDASLSGVAATFEVVSNNLSLRITLPALVGGGSINVKAAAECTYFETNILNS